jgi:[acyl-carrier-protein] S-malonyltransferase
LSKGVAVLLHKREGCARDFVMKNVMLVFPGQGSQVVGMGVAFASTPAGKELLERADEALGFGLSRLMREGPLEELTLTQNAQPALLVSGMLAFNHLIHCAKKPVGAVAALVAGHSLGEYTAVCAAGGLGFEEAVRLVRLRGEAMARAEGGAMAAVLGLDSAAAEALAGVVAPSGVVLANDNSPGQQVFSGPAQAFADFEGAAKAAGAKRVIRLNVSGAFHTAAMEAAARAVRERIIGSEDHRIIGVGGLAVPCVMNVSAMAESEGAVVAENLVRQITGRVRWREGMIFAAEAGVDTVVELGVGKVLGGLAGRCDGRLRGVSLESPAGIEEWLEGSQVAG